MLQQLYKTYAVLPIAVRFTLDPSQRISKSDLKILVIVRCDHSEQSLSSQVLAVFHVAEDEAEFDPGRAVSSEDMSFGVKSPMRSLSA